jgi:hypothetical protein
MDGNGNSFIAQLREIRSNLIDAIRTADNLEYKFVGPRPADGASTPKPTSESVGSIMAEIGAMSVRLTKMLAHHNEIVGDLGGAELAPPISSNRYA